MLPILHLRNSNSKHTALLYSSLNSLKSVVQENRASRLHVTRVRGPPPNCANNLTIPPRSTTSPPASPFPHPPPPSQSPHHPLTTSRVYTIAMYVYESSPRRSPRRVPRTEGNVLKQKTGSPIRKGKVTQGGRKPLVSSAALASVTGTGQRRRKVKINDENKENSTVGTRPTRAMGVNG